MLLATYRELLVPNIQLSLQVTYCVITTEATLWVTVQVLRFVSLGCNPYFLTKDQGPPNMTGEGGVVHGNACKKSTTGPEGSLN